MYVNKCIKCGREFETKNPKRVICPDCLYPDKSMMVSSSSTEEQPKPQAEPLNGYSAGGNDEAPRYYSAGGDEQQPRYNRPQQRQYNNQGGYNNNRNNYNRGGYNNNRQGYNRDNRGGYNNQRSGYNNNRSQQGGYNRPQRPYNNQQGGYNNRRSGGFNKFNNRRPQMKKAPKQLLVSKEQLEQIELLYKLMLPLPNPDCHEVIGEKIGLEPRKVFFGINLVRQKMMLPKLPFPKRKLAISPDQLFAIKNLYEPLLPLPPIGCHKIIAAQLKMDEWRVHVGIGLIRSQMGLGRWNEDRTDIPESMKKDLKAAADKSAGVDNEAPVAEEKSEEKPKRGRKPKKVEDEA